MVIVSKTRPPGDAYLCTEYIQTNDVQHSYRIRSGGGWGGVGWKGAVVVSPIQVGGG